MQTERRLIKNEGQCGKHEYNNKELKIVRRSRNRKVFKNIKRSKAKILQQSKDLVSDNDKRTEMGINPISRSISLQGNYKRGTARKSHGIRKQVSISIL